MSTYSVSDRPKMVCFRYYSGLSFSCLAQSEPIEVDSILKMAENSLESGVRAHLSGAGNAVKKRDLPRPGDVLRLQAKSNASSESDSDSEASSKYRFVLIIITCRRTERKYYWHREGVISAE